MNKLAKLAIVVAGLALVTQTAKALNNDILLGFTGNGASQDYMINLGNANTSVGVGSGNVTDLSSFFNLSTFNSTFTAGVNGTVMGAGGGTTSSQPTFYFTQLRGAAGDPSVNLSLQPGAISQGNASLDAGYFNNPLNTFAGLASAGGSTTVSSSDPSSFASKISSGNPGSLLGDKGLTTSYAIGSGVIYEDLWRAVRNGTTQTTTLTYTGYLTFDTTGSSPLLTFTAVPVPEPSTYGLFGAAGVLALGLRRQFSRKNA